MIIFRRSAPWVSLAALMLPIGLIWLAILGWTVYQAVFRTTSRVEIHERIIGEPLSHTFELADVSSNGVEVKHWRGTVGVSTWQMLDIGLDGSGPRIAPESENVFPAHGAHFDPPVLTMTSRDGRYVATVARDGGDNDAVWLQVDLRDNTTLSTRRLYPPLQPSLRCPSVIGYDGPAVVSIDVDNSSPRAIPAALSLTSSDLSLSAIDAPAEFPPNSVTAVRWKIEADRAHPLPGGYADIEMLGGSVGFGLMSAVRQVCTVGAPVTALIPGFGPGILLAIGLALVIAGGWLGRSLHVENARNAWRAIRGYRFKSDHLLILLAALAVGVSYWLLAGPPWYLVTVPDSTLPLLK